MKRNSARSRRAPALSLVIALVASTLGVLLPARPAVAANAIQVENAKPGTPNWYDFSASATQDAINGFGSKISVDNGSSIDFYVTTSAASFTIDIFRTGWYAGVGARLVASLGSFPGVRQAIPNPDPVTGMVAATNWAKTTTLNVPSDWVTGVYLAKLSASSGNKSFIFFVVRNDGGTEPIMFQTSVTTYQAYNAWGGTSLYTNVGNHATYSYPAATKVSFDRPFDPQDGEGAGQYFMFEYPFVRWAESQGYDLTYITDVDTHTNVNPLTNHRVFLSVGHDEYWSKGMRDNLASAIAQGTNAAFFSANTMYWQIRFEPNSAGVPNRTEVGYKDSSQFATPPGPDPMYGVNNAIVTSRWRDAPVNNPENGLMGVMYEDQVNRDYDYIVQNASHWIYAGTGFTNGSRITGIVGYEYDKVWNNGASPAGLTILSSSPVVGCCEGSGNSFANSTIYTAPSGAQVFSSGTIQWSWGLDGYITNYVNAGLQRTTANILAAFSVPLNGPLVSLAPSGLDFGGQLVGTTSAPRTSTLTNTGTAPLTMTSIAVTGTNAAEFALTNTCPLAPSTLAAGASCQISVRFTPGSTGARSASVTVADNAAGSPHVLGLTGSGSPRTAIAMPLISRGLPAFASSTILPAGYANDADYATYWTGAVPSWLAYDLSSVPTGQRGKSVVAWYNDPQTSSYEHGLVGDLSYNNLRDYTIQGNGAPGGGTAPASGWVTLATVTGNGYHSRQHFLDLTGYNWIRVSVTASDGTSGNTDAAINLDVHDASQGAAATDSWIFYGDSISMEAMHHEPANGTGNFGQLIAAAKPGFYPAFEDGGTGGIGASDGAARMATWLTAFPGRYVGVALGTNDANGCKDANAFYSDYVTMVQAVLAAGKVPIVPTIPWARTANIQSCGPGLNAKIQALYTAFPQVDRGPDFWAYFQANQSLISSDDLHPTEAGMAAYRQQWVNTALATYYGGGGTPAPAVTLTPTTLAFGSQTVGSTSASQTSTLRNTGTAALAISAIALAGANPGDFTQTNDCPASVAPNATCTITVAFRPTTGGARAAAVSVSDNASGNPHLVALSGTGTTSGGGGTITFDKSLGSKVENLSGATMTLTTSAAAVAGSRAFVFAVWNDAARTLTSVTGGGLTWTVDVQSLDDNNDHVAIASASAPSGLPSGTVLTATFSGTVTHGLIAAASFTGVATSAPLDAVGSRVQGGVAAWNATVTTSQTGDLVLAYSVIDANTTSTAAAPNVEIHDFGDANYYGWSTSAYRLGAPAGATTINGTWASASGAVGTVTVAAAYKAGSTGPAPAVTLAPASLAFGSQVVGSTSAPQSATLTNSGTGPLTITNISVTGANASEFASTNTCPLSPSTLAAGASCGISATFTPSATGARAASVQISDDASGSPHTLSLGGTGTAPAATLTPTSLAFGSQLIGTTSSAQSSTLRNTGTAPLTISGISTAGANAGEFAQTNDCPAALAASATCTITVTFSPVATGTRVASVQIADNASGSPHSLGLTGTGATPAPAVSLTPASLTFGSQLIGTSSAAQTSTLRNTGTASLAITSIGLAGANAADFQQTNDCPASLAVNATCAISVTFSPTATGARSANVSISDNAPGSPHAVGLSGTGATPAPAATLTPTTLAFGSQRVGTTSATLSSALKNTGTAPLSIASITVTGANADDFAQTNDCPGSLPVNMTCTISVTFTPGATGSRGASVSVTDDAAGSPHAVTLTGTGTAPAVTLSPSSLAFGSQRVGTTSAAQTVTLSNTGSAPLSIASIALTGTNAGDFSRTTTCALAPATLAPGASCTISVSFSPSAVGPRAASVQITDDAAGSPHSVALSGTGSTSTIAFDKSLGTKSDNANSATMTLTTSGAAVAGSRVILFVSWTHSTRTLTSVSGGGLTWTVDRQQKAAGNNARVAVASANAPAGLASGVVLTATFSGPVVHGLIAAASFTGIATAAPVDATGSATGTGTAWSAPVTTTNANDLVVGFATIDANATSSAAAPNTEIHDFGNAAYFGWSTTVYRIETAAGVKTVSGTWSSATGATGSVTIAVAYRGG